MKEEFTLADLHRLHIYRKYLPVLSKDEQERLLEEAPTLLQLQDWAERLNNRTERIDEIFDRAYKRSIRHERDN